MKTKHVLFQDITVDEAFIVRGYADSFVILVKWIDPGYAKLIYKSVNAHLDPALESMEKDKYYHFSNNVSVEKL